MNPNEGHIIHDGIRIAYLDWGIESGVTESLVVLHPNGFCAGFFDPLAQKIKNNFRVVGVDLRGHGASDQLVEYDLLGNDVMASDVVAVLDHLGIEKFSLLGHSLGGAVAIETAVALSERVSSLVLCEAIVFYDNRKSGIEREHPLATAARRRRPVWSDRRTVQLSYGSRPPLEVLAPEALSSYIHWGFKDREDDKVELACSPETEAIIFGAKERYGPMETFRRLTELTVPTWIIAGESTDLDRVWFEEQARILETKVDWVDGGHFFLFENTEKAVEIVYRCLR